MRMYSTAWSKTSAGVPISSSRGRDRAMPMNTSTAPEMRLMSTEVCTVSRRSLVAPAP